MTEQRTFDQSFLDMMIEHTGEASSSKRNTVWPPAGTYKIEYGRLDEDPDSPNYGLNGQHGFIKVPYEIVETEKNIGPGPYDHLFWFKTDLNKQFTNDLLARLNGLDFIPFGTVTPGSVTLERARDLNGRTAFMVRTTFLDDGKVERAKDRYFLSKAEMDEASKPKKLGGDPEPSSEEITQAINK